MSRRISALRILVATTLVVLLVLPAAASATTAEPPRTEGDAAAASKEDSAEPTPSRPKASEPKDKTPAVRAAADLPRSRVGVTKETSLGDQPLTPGKEFTYIITVRCSGLTVGCVNQSVLDVLPEGLEVTSLPKPTGGREVSFDKATRELTIDFTEELQAPVGRRGLSDGSTRVIEVGVRLPANTSLADGASIPNTATTTADNADPVDDTVAVPVSIPREVRPVATKTWSDGSAIAGSGEASSATLGIRNASSGSVVVDELVLTDSTPATYESFDLTGVALTALPAGADRAQLLVCTVAGSDCAADDYTAGPTASSLGTLSLPDGTTAADVTGFRVRFFAADGSALPFDSTGGTVKAGYVLRETLRSTGEPLKPTTKRTVRNCAVPGALSDGEPTAGPAACATYDILPDTVVLAGTKTFFPDTNGNFSKQDNEHAVVGEDSPVTASIGVTNNSAFPLREISIVEPDAAGPGVEFDKLDVSKVRLRFPSGATKATLKVEYDQTAFNLSTTHGADAVVDLARAGARVTRIEVVYTGEDGEPSIAIGATARLEVHGTLNDKVTSDDLPNGSSPGVGNCAAFTGAADIRNSTGTASGNACASLQVEPKRHGGTGVKTNGQGDIPLGQPIPFTLDLRNNGNVPLIDPVLSDPPTDSSGTPVTKDNPFAVVRLVSAAVVKGADVPDVDLEVYDPQAARWVAYDAADSELLTRTTGVRARVDGAMLPGSWLSVGLVTQRRDNVPDGVTLHNCMTASADDWVTAEPICSAQVETGPVSSTGAINKSIAPGTLPRPIPGVPEQSADVKIAIANTGNVNAKRLVLTDDDADFFDAVRFGSIKSVAFPKGANRVQIDAKTDDGWIDGEPRTSLDSYPLPAGVTAAEVTGIRVTFSDSSGGYTLRPCEGSPTPASCTGVVTFVVHPMQTTRSTGEVIPDELGNTVVGGYEGLAQTPGRLQPIDPTEATLELVEGDAELDVEKTPNSVISPGETAPFRLTVTNSGTSNLPDLVVEDALPAGLELDETFAGDGGAPFRLVDTQVPAGTDPVPTPDLTLTRDADRVSGLRWTFGGWTMRPGARFSIEIQVKLAPGVREGQLSRNMMGATSSHPRLACADGTGTDPDDLFGAGTWCTDSADVVTKAGAAFQARKWVAGNDGLGWFNGRTQRSVGIGSDSCPSRVEGGRTYTAFPCVALVNPGDEYDYLLRMVNAGTEPATDMRIIDRFPVKGDKGVVLDDVDRGTQWDNRPTLASEPQLLGSGALTTTYADGEAGYCADDLDMRSSCGAGTWSDPFSADAIAAQMRVAWADPLAPGAGVSIIFSMKTPLEVAQVADPTIAWNSFGHAEKTVRGNGSRVLPPTEPIQVGVATAYGTLQVRKEITANPGNLPVDDRSYPIDHSCTIKPIGGAERVVAEGTLDVTAGTVETVSGIPAGATCRVWEIDTAGGVTNHPADDPAEVTIKPQLGDDPAEPVMVTVENAFPLAQLDITKVVDGPAAAFGASTMYDVEVTCAMDDVVAKGFPQTVHLTGSATETIDAPVGSTCTAVETDDGGATGSVISPVDGVIVTGDADASLELTVTNTFEQGRLRILKQLEGAGADLPTGPFVFEVACTFEGRDIDPITVTLKRDGDARQLVGDVDEVLPVGAECLVSEIDDGGADATPPPVTVTTIENDDANTVTVTFTNQFSAGTIALEKLLAGASADNAYVTDAVFAVDVTCAVGKPDQVVYSRTTAIRGGDRLALTGADDKPVVLPLGSRCWAVESDAGGATSVSIAASSWDDAVEVKSGTPDDLQVLELVVTNTFDAAELTVAKKVVYGGPGPYRFGVQCTLAGRELPLDPSDARFELKADEARTIDVIAGADCVVRELDVPESAEVSYRDSDGDDDGRVQVDRTARVVVTNTFDPDVSSTLPDTGGPARAWLVLAVALIVAGLGLGIGGRRRERV